jgi:tRNA G46 methylase TrmB
MQEVFSREALLERAERGFADKPVTKFEARGKRLGHPIRELFFRRAR